MYIKIIGGGDSFELFFFGIDIPDPDILKKYIVVLNECEY